MYVFLFNFWIICVYVIKIIIVLRRFMDFGLCGKLGGGGIDENGV